MAERVPAVQLPTGCDELIIFACNLQDEDAFVLEYSLGDGCTPENACYAPFAPNGQVVRVTPENNPVVVSVPGFYRVVPDGFVSPDAMVQTKVSRRCA